MKSIKNLLSIALREIKERKALLGLSVVLGLLPLLVMQANKFGISLAQNDIGTISVALFIAFTIGFGLVIGASLFGRDLAERRMSFYFARPLSAFSIWGGKILGGVSLAAISGLIMMLPTILFFGTSTDVKNFFTVSNMIEYTVINLFFLAVGTVGGIIFRSKSYWLALDLGLVPVAILLIFLSLRRLLVPWPTIELHDFPEYMVVGVTLLLLASTGAAIMFGRTDIKRVHRAMSVSFWGLALFAILSFDGFSRWYVSADIDDLTSLNGFVGSAPNGNWIAMSGKAWGRSEQYQPQFLFNTATGKSVKLGTVYSTMISFSADGKRVVWTETKASLGGATRHQLVTMVTDDGEPKPVYTDLSFSNDEFTRLALNFDGTRLATVGERMITIYDTNTMKEISSTYIKQSSSRYWNEHVFFLTNDKLRVYRYDRQATGEGQVTINELDIPANKLNVMAQFSSDGWLTTSKNRDLLLSSFNSTTAGTNQKPYIKLLDANTGSLISEIGQNIEGKERFARFLSNDQIVVTERSMTDDQVTLKIYNKAGVEEKAIPVAKGRHMTALTEMPNNQLMLTMANADQAINRFGRSYIIDLNNNTATLKIENAGPANYNNYFFNGSDAGRYNVESSKLFITAEGKLTRIDLTSGQRQNVDKLKLTE